MSNKREESKEREYRPQTQKPSRISRVNKFSLKPFFSLKFELLLHSPLLFRRVGHTSTGTDSEYSRKKYIFWKNIYFYIIFPKIPEVHPHQGVAQTTKEQKKIEKQLIPKEKEKLKENCLQKIIKPRLIIKKSLSLYLHSPSPLCFLLLDIIVGHFCWTLLPSPPWLTNDHTGAMVSPTKGVAQAWKEQKKIKKQSKIKEKKKQNWKQKFYFTKSLIWHQYSLSTLLSLNRNCCWWPRHEKNKRK